MTACYRSSRLLVLVAAGLALASMAAAASAPTPVVWWSNPDDPHAFVVAATIMGGIGGGLKLLTQWERFPGWPRLLGALGLGPFVGFVTALLAFKAYRTTPEDLMTLLAYCAAAGFCCDWVAARFVDLAGRVLTPPGGASR